MPSAFFQGLGAYASAVVAPLGLHHVLVVLVTLAGALVLGLVLMKVIHRIGWNRKARALGAKPPKAIFRLKDPILGLDYMLGMIRAGKLGRYLPLSRLRFQQLECHTYVTRRLFFDTVHTMEPENLKSMLSLDFHSFKTASSRVEAFHNVLGDGILASDGEKWARARALLRPSFTRKNMQPLIGMMERHFQSMVRHIPVDGSTFDVQHLFSCLAMDTGTEFLLLHSTNSLDSTVSSQSDARFVSDYTQSCLDVVYRMQMGPLQRFVPFAASRKRIEARDRIWSYIHTFVAEALELRRSGKLDMVDDDSNDDDDDDPSPGYSFLLRAVRDTDDPVALRNQIIHVLLASRDTTSGLLSHFFWEISRRPDIFRKLREEIEAHLQGKQPTDAQLKDLTYLRWCITETLRLYPSVPVNSRESAVDTTLPSGGGDDGKQPIFVPKGTTIYYYVYAMHRREDIFGPDAQSFRPERWENLRPGWGYLPFNGGPRICVGQQYALMEASYIIVRMLQTFSSIEARDDRPWTELYTLALFSKNGVQIAVRHATSPVSGP